MVVFGIVDAEREKTNLKLLLATQITRNNQDMYNLQVLSHSPTNCSNATISYVTQMNENYTPFE